MQTNAELIVASLPTSPDLARSNGVSYRARTNPEHGHAELFFRLPSEGLDRLVSELTARGITLTQAQSGGQIVPDTMVMTDAEGWRFRAFAEVLCSTYPEAWFNLPALNAGNESLWVDARGAGRGLELVTSGVQPFLVMHLDDGQTAFSESALDHLREREGFRPIPGSNGLVSTKHVQVNESGDHTAQLGSLFRLMGAGTTLIPMNRQQMAGIEPLPGRYRTTSVVAQQIQDHLSDIGHVLSSFFIDQAPTISRLARQLKSTPRDHLNESLEVEPDRFGFSQLQNHTVNLSNLAHTIPEYRNSIVKLLGLTISDTEWEMRGDLISQDIADVVALGTTDEIDGAAQGAGRLAEFIVNPGYPESEWLSFMFRDDGTGLSDSYSAIFANNLMKSRWDGAFNLTGTALAMDDSVTTNAGDLRKVQARLFFADPMGTVDKAIFEADPTALSYLASVRAEEERLDSIRDSELSIEELALNHMANKPSALEESVTELALAHISAKEIGRGREQASDPFEAMDFDSINPDLGKTLKKEQEFLQSETDQYVEFNNIVPGSTAKDNIDNEINGDDVELNLDEIDDSRNDGLAELVGVSSGLDQVIQVSEQVELETGPGRFALDMQKRLRQDHIGNIVEDLKTDLNPNRVSIQEGEGFYGADEPNEKSDAAINEDPSFSADQPVVTATIDSKLTESDVDESGVVNDTAPIEDQAPKHTDKNTDISPADAILAGKSIPSFGEMQNVNVMARLIRHRHNIDTPETLSPLVQKGNFLLSRILPSPQIEDEDIISAKEAEFQEVLDALSTRNFNELAGEHYKGPVANAVAMVALIGSLMPGADLEGLALMDSAVSQLIQKQKWSGVELDLLLTKIPVSAQRQSTALMDNLVATKDFERVIAFSTRHVSQLSTIPDTVLRALSLIPEDSPEDGIAVEIAERIEHVRKSETVLSEMFSDGLIRTLLANKEEQAGREANRFHLSTGYKKSGDMRPLDVTLINPAAGDLQIAVMSAWGGDLQDGLFSPDVTFEFASGQLVRAWSDTGGDRVQMDTTDAQIAWENTSSKYRSLPELEIIPGKVPNLSAVADINLENVNDFDSEALIDLEPDDLVAEADSPTQALKDDLLRIGKELDNELLAEGLTEEHGDDFSTDAIYDFGDQEDIDFIELENGDGLRLGSNRFNERVTYHEKEDEVSNSTVGYRLVNGEEYSDPIDALLLPNTIPFGSNDHQALLVANFSRSFNSAEVLSGEKFFSRQDLIRIAAIVSVKETETYPSSMAAMSHFTGEDSAQALAMMEECVEAAESLVGRELVSTKFDRKPEAGLTAVKILSQALPARMIRTGEQRSMQQFSTPLPAAVSLGRLLREHVGLTNVKDGEYLDPTAGTGALLVNVPGQMHIVANELSPSRSHLLNCSLNLKHTDVTVTTRDATTADFRLLSRKGEFDGVLANPPFGSMDSPLKVGGYTTKRIDHGIVLKSLQSLSDDGIGVFIVGGDSYLESERGRLSASSQGFLNHVQDNYNVIGISHVELSEYKQRDAAWPLTVFVVEGRFPTDDRIDLSKPLESIALDMAAFDQWTRGVSVRLLDIPGMREAAHRSKQARERQLARIVEIKQGASALVRGSRTREIVSQGVDITAPVLLEEVIDPVLQLDAASEHTNTGLAVPAPGKKPDSEPTSDNESASKKAIDEDSVVVESEKPLKYIPRSKLGRTDVGSVVISAGLNRGMDDAFDFITKKYGSVDKLISYCLGFSEEKVTRVFADYQCDALALAFATFDIGNEFLNGMGTGTGKGIVQAGMLQMNRTLNARLERGEIRREDYGITDSNTKVPVVFMCEKPGLFQDFFLRDLGMVDEDLRSAYFPIIINETGSAIYQFDETGKRGALIAKHDPVLMAKLRKNMSLDGLVPNGKIPLIMSTYSQHQNPGRSPVKNNLMKILCDGSILLLDESHNAAGEESNINSFVAGLKDSAVGVMSSSATGTKRLAQAEAYRGIFANQIDFETLKKVSMKDSEYVLELLFRGSAQLGTSFAVSRDIGKSKFEYDECSDFRDRNLDIGDRFALALQALGRFSGEVNEQSDIATKQYKVANQGYKADEIPYGAPTSLVSTNFGSLNHNLCKLFSVLLNLERTVEMAIEDVKAGSRVVIAMDSTMGAVIDYYLAEIKQANALLTTPAGPGQDALSLDLNMTVMQAEIVMDGVIVEGSMYIIPRELDARDAITRTLDRMLWVTERRTGVPSVKRNVYEIAMEVAEQGVRDTNRNPETLRAEIDMAVDLAVSSLDRYIDSIRSCIHNIGNDLPLSPLDYLQNRLAEQGICVGEISGRQTVVKVGGGQTVISKRAKDNKQSIISGFNQRPNNDPERCDVVLITRSGASGISLHDSITNSHSCNRSLIFAQIADDVNQFRQTMGRVDRAAQRTSPKITLVSPGLLFSLKSISSMARKLRQSGAATVGSRDGGFQLPETPDYFNSVGDTAAFQLLVDNPDILELLADGGLRHAKELLEKMDGSFDIKDYSDGVENLAKSVVAYTSIMTQEQGKRVSGELESRYYEHYKNLERLGQNPLTTLQLEDGVVITESMMVRQSFSKLEDGRVNPFSGDVNQCAVVIPQVIRVEACDDIDRVIMTGGRWLRTSSLAEQLELTGAKNFSEVSDWVESRKDHILAKFVRAEDIRAGIVKHGDQGSELLNRLQALPTTLLAEDSNARLQAAKIQYIMDVMPKIGLGLTLWIQSNYSDEQAHGVIQDIMPPDHLSFLTNLSAWRLKVSIPSEGSQIRTLSQLHEEKAIFTGESWKDNELYSSLNNQVALNAVSQREILTGNQISVLQEFSDLASVSSACKGIIGGVEQTALILPGSISNAQLPANRRPNLSGHPMIEALWEYKNGSDNDQVRLFFAPTLVYMKGRLLPEGHLDIREDDFSVRLLSSNASGHSKVYKDKELRKLAFKDFAGFGIHVSTKFDKSRLKEVLSILESHGIKLFADVDDKTWVNDYIQASIDIRDRAVADMVYESRLGVPEFDIIPLIERDSDELLLLAADPSAPYVSAEPENISPVAEVWDSNNEMDLFGDIDDYVIKQVDSRSKR